MFLRQAGIFCNLITHLSTIFAGLSRITCLSLGALKAERKTSPPSPYLQKVNWGRSNDLYTQLVQFSTRLALRSTASNALSQQQTTGRILLHAVIRSLTFFYKRRSNEEIMMQLTSEETLFLRRWRSGSQQCGFTSFNKVNWTPLRDTKSFSRLLSLVLCQNIKRE